MNDQPEGHGRGEGPSSFARADATARLIRARVGEGARWIDVEGGSMLPTIAPPARVLVEPALRPRAGEVWAFVDDDAQILAHRFIRQVHGQLRFKGDGSPRADALVGQERVIGRVVRAVDPAGERPVRRRRFRAWREAVDRGVRRRFVVRRG